MIATPATAIMTPYNASTVRIRLSEYKIDASSRITLVWSTTRNPGTAYPALTPTPANTCLANSVLPASVATASTYLFTAEVHYAYTPTIGYVMAKTGINLSDVAFTRPRQSVCVFYAPTSATMPTTCSTF